MADNLIRIRLIRLPVPRDLEYLVLRYVRLNGTYDVPLEVAKDLIEFGYASPADGSDPLTDFSGPPLPDSSDRD